MAAWLLVGVYFYLFIYSPFRVGCWLYKLTTTELWASRRKWSRQFHALSSFFFFLFYNNNGCALLLLLLYDSCVYCQAKKWRLGVISGYHVFFRFLSFLSPPPPKILFVFSVCRQFDNNFMILFILPPPPIPSLLYYIQMGCSCLEYWSGVVVEEIESGLGEREGRVSINGSAWSCKSHQVTLGCIRSCASPSPSL